MYARDTTMAYFEGKKSFRYSKLFYNGEILPTQGPHQA